MLLDAGGSIVALRMGAEGSLIASQDMPRPMHIPAADAKVVDVTGCGNAFNGGLLAALQRGAELDLAGAWGSAAASCMAEAEGAHRRANFRFTGLSTAALYGPEANQACIDAHVASSQTLQLWSHFAVRHGVLHVRARVYCQCNQTCSPGPKIFGAVGGSRSLNATASSLPHTCVILTMPCARRATRVRPSQERVVHGVISDDSLEAAMGWCALSHGIAATGHGTGAGEDCSSHHAA